MPPVSSPQPVELFLPEIRQLLGARDFEGLRVVLAEMNPVDVAEGLERFNPEERMLLFKLLKPEAAIKAFAELDLPRQEELVQKLDDQSLAPLLGDIPTDVTATLFKKLPDRVVRRMTFLMKKERMETVQEILDYPPETAGALMQTDVVSLSPDLTARAALSVLQARTRLRRGEVQDALFVTGTDRRLLGWLALRTLVAAPPDMRLREVMSPASFIKIPGSMDREEAAQRLSRYKLTAAPVVDEQSRLLGVLTVDDVIQVIQQEDTEDIQKMAGVEALDEPYFDIGFFKMIKKRGTWLCVLFLGEMLTATAMAFFEKEIAKAVVLALFIPLIISSGGNSGSQAATLIVRAMALKEVGFGDWWRVMRREILAGLVLGTILGAIGFLRIFLWSQVSPIYGQHYLLVASTVGFSLVLVVLWGSLSGSMLPILLKRIGLDPAVVSAPFVATLVDVTGLVIYFSVGFMVLKGTLL
jgi:magnesium transporter